MDEMTTAMLQQIQEVEQKDEHQVLAELAGETIAEYIYETEVWNPKTKRKDRKVRLSWVGVREVARSRGNIMLSDPAITDLDDAVRIVVKATDLTRNFTVFGGCHQPKRMKVNDVDKPTGEITGFHYEDDPYYFTKGLSKAQRNAMNPCIPADYAVKMIDRFLRSSGRPPLLANPADKQKPPVKEPPQKIAEKSATPPPPAPTKQAVNMAKEKWDKITKEQVSTYPLLEQVFWDLTKKQPAELYKELGGGTRNDMTIPAWEAFLALKEIFAPQEKQP